jgi:hypothetical protein
MVPCGSGSPSSRGAVGASRATEAEALAAVVSLG